MRRVMTDQIVFAPFGLALFVGAMGIMEGRHSFETLKEKYNDVRKESTYSRYTFQLF